MAKKSKKVTKKVQPDYQGAVVFLAPAISKSVAEQFEAIKQCVETYHVKESEAKKILRDLVKQAEEARKQNEKLETEYVQVTSVPTMADILKKEAILQEKDKFTPNTINWTENPYYNSWDKCKGRAKQLMGNKETYDETKKADFYFIAHSRDIIKGKPQLIDPIRKTIPVIRMAVKNSKKELPHLKEKLNISKKTEIELQSFYFIDEPFDRRHDGFLKEIFPVEYLTYRIIDQQQEYYVLTKEPLPNCVCEVYGMNVKLDDFTEMSKSLKIKSLSNIFFAKSFTPSIKVLSPKEIVEFTKKRELTEEKWNNYLEYHPRFNNFNRCPQSIREVKSIQILSSCVEGYPLTVIVFGTQGLKKSSAILETTAYKFEESPKILEGGNSRLKALIPSFKEKPANIGYLAKCERFGYIDELGKMLEFEMSKHQATGYASNLLGEINFLIEHRLRGVGSGNDNDCDVQATAKFIFATNPVSNRPFIHSHVGLIDPTTLSRKLIWVIDNEEKEFLLSDKAIEEVSPNTYTSISPILDKHSPTEGIEKRNKDKDICLNGCWGELVRDEFLTLFDTCQSFLSVIDKAKVLELAKTIANLTVEPMRSVWKPRANHHVTLIIDGFVKLRCLFKDYDSSFTAKQEDYDKAEKLLIRMVKGWETDMSTKEDFR